MAKALGVFEIPQLSSFEVAGLFGEFNHKIPINTKDRVTAILAPNGTGKTICLRLINALFTRQWSYFPTILFDEVLYEFTSGLQVRITKLDTENTDTPTPRQQIVIEITSSTGAVLYEPIADVEAAQNMLTRHLPFLSKLPSEQWIHDFTGEQLTFTDIHQRYRSHLPAKFFQSVYPSEPAELTAIISEFDCHLIETQRLLLIVEDVESAYRSYGRRATSQLAIAAKAKALSQIIAQELQRYAALSQSLDRSFPQRVINLSKALSPTDLSQNFKQLDEKRTRLTEAGILEKEYDPPFTLPSGKVDDAISKVLSVYTDDTAKKLGSLSKLLERIQLFKELVESRFTRKEIVIDKKAGIKVRHGDNEIPLDSLSSGEQHQLVLFFELLFELKKNALILIDEPELSLHVAWQIKFISDLRRIIEVNEFDVILATHSPQLIGHYEHLLVELGDTEAL